MAYVQEEADENRGQRPWSRKLCWRPLILVRLSVSVSQSVCDFDPSSFLASVSNASAVRKSMMYARESIVSSGVDRADEVIAKISSPLKKGYTRDYFD